jgi:hypothetical protein
LAAFACRILLEHEPLSASTAFTALAWFNILKRPLQVRRIQQLTNFQSQTQNPPPNFHSLP